MVAFAIRLFISASHPTVTRDARETGDWPAHRPGLLTGVTHWRDANAAGYGKRGAACETSEKE